MCFPIMDYKNLADHIKQLKQTQQILHKVKGKTEKTETKETKVKQEPIGLVRKTKDGKNQCR